MPSLLQGMTKMTKHLTDAVSAMLELDTEKMSEYVTLTLEKRLVAAETTKRNARLKELEQDMLDQFLSGEDVEPATPHHH